MPWTETQICNVALSLLGAGEGDVAMIQRYETDQTKTAGWCRALLPLAIEEILGEHDWIEATGYKAPGAALTGTSIPVNPDWDYAYSLPENPVCITFLGVVGAESVDADGVESSYPYAQGCNNQRHYILCHEEADDILFKYVGLVGVRFFSPGLAGAVAGRLATYLAMSLGKEDRVAIVERKAETRLQEAIGADVRKRYDGPAVKVWGDTTDVEARIG